jgi:hypothetical protein
MALAQLPTNDQCEERVVQLGRRWLRFCVFTQEGSQMNKKRLLIAGSALLVVTGIAYASGLTGNKTFVGWNCQVGQSPCPNSNPLEDRVTAYFPYDDITRGASVFYYYPYYSGTPLCNDTLSFASSSNVGTHYTYHFNNVTSTPQCAGTKSCPAHVTIEWDSTAPNNMTYTWSTPTCGCPPGGCGPTTTGPLTLCTLAQAGQFCNINSDCCSNICADETCM